MFSSRKNERGTPISAVDCIVPEVNCFYKPSLRRKIVAGQLPLE